MEQTKVAQKEEDIISEHTCQAVVLHCIDFRFRESLNAHLQGATHDLVSVAGGVQGLLSEGPAQDFLLSQLDVSCRLHDPSEISIIQHEDCGAYGGSTAIGEGETEFQTAELKRAAEILRQRYPGRNVQAFFAELSGNIIPIEVS